MLKPDEVPPLELLEWQRQAAESAVCHVQSGMVVGLGTGSTAAFAVTRIGQLLRGGQLEGIVGVPTSRAVEALAREQGIPLATLAERSSIDVTIDGADEVDPLLNLIKGGGAALLREKIVARVTRCEIIVIDESKLVPRLGMHAPLPVEVLPFASAVAAQGLAALGGRPVRRLAGGQPLLTDEGNYIFDCRFEAIGEPTALDQAIRSVPGVVEHGLFLGLAGLVIVGGRKGLRLLRAEDASCRNGREQWHPHVVAGDR